MSVGSWFRRLCVALFLLGIVGCPSKQCSQDKDCQKAGTFCDVERNVCVACLTHENCPKNKFCCQGECKDKSELEELCGCHAVVDGFSGHECKTKYELGTTTVDGPMCLLDGGEPTIERSAESYCGCNENNGIQCKAKNGLKGLCKASNVEKPNIKTCVAQGREACGESLTKCEAATGGTLCQADPSKQADGRCQCDPGELEATCIDDGSGHKSANACVPVAGQGSICQCGDNAACSGEQKDCCGKQCVDFQVSASNCGACSNKCEGVNGCFRGQCECKANQCSNNEECQKFARTAKEDISICVCPFFGESGKKERCGDDNPFCCNSQDTNRGDIVGCCSKPCGEAKPGDCINRPAA